MSTDSSKEPVSVEVADSVILDMATRVLIKIPGVHSLSTRFIDEVMDGIGQKFGKKPLPGMNLKHRKDGLEINIYFRAYYGYQLIDLSKKIQKEIRQHLEHMLSLKDVKVDVHIEGLVSPDKEKENHAETK